MRCDTSSIEEDKTRGRAVSVYILDKPWQVGTYSLASGSSPLVVELVRRNSFGIADRYLPWGVPSIHEITPKLLGYPGLRVIHERRPEFEVKFMGFHGELDGALDVHAYNFQPVHLEITTATINFSLSG